MAAGSLIVFHESLGALGVTLAAKSTTAAYTLSFPVLAPSAVNTVRVYDAAGDSIFKTLSVDSTITLTPTTGALTFSLPQSIATSASPTFAGATLTAFSGVVKATAGVLSASSIVNADVSASAGIVDTKLATISTAGKVANSATTATNANTGSAIVARDAAGAFSAGAISAASMASSGAVSGSTLASSGNTTVGDFLLLGNATFKVKRLTGSTDGAGAAVIAHGLTGSKIMAMFGRIDLTTEWHPVPSYNSSSLYTKGYWDGTYVRVTGVGSTFYSKNLVIYVIYES
jgi:hypothetical protein